MIYSFSRLSLYATCPQRFRFKYIEGWKEPATKPMALGKAVHKALEQRINGLNIKEAVIAGLIEADFHPEVTANEIVVLVQRALLLKNGETEVHFQLPLSIKEDIEIQGYIDFTDGSSLIDWKTGWRMYDINQTHQIGVYAWALSQMHGYDLVEGSLYFLRYKKRMRRFFSESEREDSRKWAEKLAIEIQRKLNIMDIAPEAADKLFPAKQSEACRHCPFVLECYAKRKGGLLNEPIKRAENNAGCCENGK